MTFLLWLFVWIGCAAIGGLLAAEKGRGPAGFWLGFIFGPLGIVIALLLAEERKPLIKPITPMRRTPMTPEDADFAALIKARGKVGIALGDRQIISVAEGSPAAIAGVMPGDRIIAIDDQIVRGDVKAVTMKLTGERGTPVKVSVRRGEEAFDFTLTRA